MRCVSPVPCDNTTDDTTYSFVRRGFTLVEILVVIVVISLLAALVAPNVFRNVDAAKTAAARSQIEMLSAALDMYRMDNSAYPTGGQGLEALRREPLSEPRPGNWRGPYLRKDVPPDPWGRPYIYQPLEDVLGFELKTLGSDAKVGGSGDAEDISNLK